MEPTRLGDDHRLDNQKNSRFPDYAPPLSAPPTSGAPERYTCKLAADHLRNAPGTDLGSTNELVLELLQLDAAAGSGTADPAVTTAPDPTRVYSDAHRGPGRPVHEPEAI